MGVFWFQELISPVAKQVQEDKHESNTSYTGFPINVYEAPSL